MTPNGLLEKKCPQLFSTSIEFLFRLVRLGLAHFVQLFLLEWELAWVAKEDVMWSNIWT